ncbi:mercury(II) reductase [Nocardiopsis alborubida]|uniref:Mercuric reductase n=1 Tax=Nocardiopsis alborubida TaxID=146802 RepID=A0A7X6M911_9ACTN|nr:mercury(II) reductase [Nocardiopsis alborubida]NKY96674.1 mercury(II) reductase [Nocardiopsis alborubida]
MAFDLAVIGSGGAAFAAAIAARRKDRSVVMIEHGTIGGTCVNTGCVPSKALLAAAEARHVALSANRFPGIRTSAEDVDLAELIEGKRALVEDMRADKYVDLAAEYGWEIVSGHARFAEGPALAVELADGGSRRIEAAHYVIATGSQPWAPYIEGLTEAGYLISTTAMELEALPSSLLVVGGNYIGLEQAQLFARLGVEVTVVEALDHLAPNEEPEAGEAIAQVFADEGITVRTGATISRLRREGGRVVATVDGQELVAEEVLVATGRRPVTDGLNLDAVGVQVDAHGEVVVDEYLRTTNPRIWAAGDVTGHPQFVYVAGAHGAVVADNALDGADRVLDYRHLPRVTFTSPAIAGVGLTDAQAERAGLDCECRVLPLENVPRALVNRDTRGLIKVVAERGTGRVVGVTAVAEGAGDVIAAAVYAVQAGMSVDQMANTWCPYLTMAEGLKLAAQTFTRDVAKLSCCAS